MTHAFGGKTIKDCVITVPASFTQHEREALYTAAEIAELKVLSLIEENTAAALHYGIDRVFEQPSTVLYYNMGAGSVQVTIVTYSSYTVKEAGKNKTVGQFEVLGKAWDASLGGFNFDVRLADLLATRFNEIWSKKASGKGKDLRDFVRPMTRLRLEANKVKEVLSANAEFPIKAEQLHADIDLTTKVTRTEFEEACKDLFARLTEPIDKALAMANLSLADVQTVELLGGAVRMPKVKKVLDEYFKPANIDVGQHLNGDEAMALGAAFRAANLSTAFRVRKVGMTDVSSFGVAVRLETLPDAGDKKSGGLFGGMFGSKTDSKHNNAPDAEKWSKFTSLYPKKSAVPSKMKTVAFNYDKDILCRLEYESSDASDVLPTGTSPYIAVYNITGITEFAKEQAEKGLGMPKVHLSFGLDSSGLVQLIKAEATVDLPVVEEPATDAASNSTETADAAAASAAETTESASNESNSTTSAAATAASTNETTANTTEPVVPAKKDVKKDKPKEKKNNVIRKVLLVDLDETLAKPPKWTPERIDAARDRLKALNAIDEARKAKAQALNDLEAYIYKTKNRIMDEEDKLKSISTDAQRQEVIDLANAAEEWLYDDGRDATVIQYQNKQYDIKVKADAIFKRHSELTLRTDAVVKAKKDLDAVKRAVGTWEDKMPHITEDEKSALLKLVETADKWIEEKADAQEKTSPFEKPAFDSSEVPLQLKPVISMYDKLMKKPKPVPPAPEVVVS